MSQFIGTYADLEGFGIGNKFVIDEICGRDAKKAPVWSVRCQRCRAYFTVPHQKLCNALESGRPEEIILCVNQSCPQSRPQTPRPETLADMRRAEQRQQRQQQIEAEQNAAKRADEQKAETNRQNAVRAEKLRYLKFANAQILAGVPVEQIMSFQRWQQQGQHWRQELLQKIERITVNGER